MVDESFHLTALDARRYDFGSALRGYDKVRVDQFREQVADELERLTRVAQDLESKAKGFHEQLRAFRERDKALNEALVSAQQLRGEIREQADRESQLIIREGQAQAERVLEDARAEVRRLQMEVDALERTRRVHLAQLRALAQRQLTEIEAAEHIELTVAEAVPVPAPAVVVVSAVAAQPVVAPPVATAAAITPPPPPFAPPAAAASAPEAPAVPASEPPAKREDRKSAARNLTPLWLDASVPE